MNPKTVEKLLSGRWFLTIVGGVAFLYCVWQKQLEAAAIAVILTSIFKDYFLRSDRSGTNHVDKT